MASSSGNFTQNTKEGCQSKGSLPGKEYVAMVSSQSFERRCDWKNTLPIGFRFKPTDEELVDYYLRVKKNGGGIIYDNIIKDLDIYQYEPSQLKNFAYDHGDGKMYFYSPLHRKYANGEKAKRDCPGGFWKMSQKTSTVGDIGTKSPLAFHSTEHNSKGVKTQWLMQQYRLTDTKHPGQTENPNKLLEEYVLCVVYYKNKSDGDSQNSMPSKKRSSLNLGKASRSHSVSSPPSSCCNFVSSPFAEQYQNPHYKPNIFSYNNSQMASYSNLQYNLYPKPTSSPNMYIKPNTYPPIYSSHYASSSNYIPSPNHRPAMNIPFSNPITSIPNPGANLSMNYGTHSTINTSGPSPSPNPNPSADLRMRTTVNLDSPGLNNQQEPSIN